MTLDLFGGHDRHMLLPGKPIPDVMREVEPVAQRALDGIVGFRLGLGMIDLAHPFVPLSMPFWIHTQFHCNPCLPSQMLAFSEGGIDGAFVASVRVHAL